MMVLQLQIHYCLCKAPFDTVTQERWSKVWVTHVLYNSDPMMGLVQNTEISSSTRIGLKYAKDLVC